MLSHSVVYKLLCVEDVALKVDWCTLNDLHNRTLQKKRARERERERKNEREAYTQRYRPHAGCWWSIVRPPHFISNFTTATRRSAAKI